MKTAYSAATLGAMTYGAGVLMVGSTYLGVSKGGFTFDEGRTSRQPEFDGMTSPIAGNDRVVEYRPTIKGTWLEAPDAMLSKLANTSTAPAGSPTKVLVGNKANAFIAKGALLADVRAIVDRGDGTLIAHHFPYAYVSEWSYKSSDKGEGEFSVTFEARLDPAGTPLDLEVPPHRYEIRVAVP